ncbi:polyhydroxyalkanoic acid system family protein [uncultured Sphingomonas sp.]|uniref:polyhydroxyalkanoic acid system family protein n=1 Tax=uncultured Sphingomonas sp. TaxID=158754 RepID=UPI0025E544AE|nr:polyhydroxyalkanoic acid system family protein [uncultured Sphingomonas sp.]
MSDPVELDIAHSLGRDAAKSRIAGGIAKLESYIPGGKVTEHHWDGDRLMFNVAAMGQRAAATVDVLEDKVHLKVELPPFLAMFANKIRDVLGREGPKLLK